MVLKNEQLNQKTLKDFSNNDFENFKFTDENLKKAKEIIAKYPDGKQQSAVLPLLDIAQRQAGGWLPKIVIEYVANFLNMPFIRVYEVASFYTMFYLKPVGKYNIQICGTTPCMLRGAEDLVNLCKNKLGIKKGETSTDGKFTLQEVECLGACINAPIVQINDDYYEDLTTESFEKIIKDLSSK